MPNEQLVLVDALQRLARVDEAQLLDQRVADEVLVARKVVAGDGDVQRRHGRVQPQLVDVVAVLVDVPARSRTEARLALARQQLLFANENRRARMADGLERRDVIVILSRCQRPQQHRIERKNWQNKERI